KRRLAAPFSLALQPRSARDLHRQHHAVVGQLAEVVAAVAVGAIVAQRHVGDAEAAAHAHAPVGVVLGDAALEGTAADVGAQAEFVGQAPLAADAVVPAIGAAVPYVVAVADVDLPGVGDGGGGDQLVVGQLAGAGVGIAVEQHVEVDLLADVEAVADEEVHFHVGVAGAEIHARAPGADVQAHRRGPGQARLHGGLLVGLRGRAEQVVRYRADFPADGRFGRVVGGS